MTDERIISVHIPKTGGGSFEQVLASQFGSRLVSFNITHVTIPAWHPQRWLQELKAAWFWHRLPSNWAVVHGHFRARDVVRRFPEARLAVWLRDPVERVVSHYYYWLRQPHFLHPTCRRMVRRKMSLEQFAELRPLQNIHVRFLQGIDIERFDFVGLTEQYERSLELFSRRFLGGRRLPTFARNVNPQRSRSRYDIPPRLRGRIAELNQLDIELYQRGRDRFCELCRQWGVETRRAA